MIPPSEDSIDLICPQCGYDLRGIDSARCPECGTPFDRATASLSRIPWANRTAIGRWRAYLQTVRIATFRPMQLANEFARPVSYRDAQRFRWITVALTALPLMIAGTIAYLYFDGANAIASQLDVTRPFAMGGPIPLPDLTLAWPTGAEMWPLVPASLLIFFTLVSGVQSYWFHPRALPMFRQNRAVAISGYICSPIFWLPWILSVWAFVIWYADHLLPKMPLYVGVALVLCEIAFAAIWFFIWLNTLRVLSRTVDASWPRLISAAIGLPIFWLLSAVIAFGLLPWLVGLIWLMIDSLR